MSYRSAAKKPPKKVSDTNRDRRARRGQKQASPKPTPAPEPVVQPPMPVQDAALLPTFVRDLLLVTPEPAVPVPDPEPALPPADQVVEGLMEQLGSLTPFGGRSGLPADHPAHRLSPAQWVRLQVTLEAMGRGENVWRAIKEALDHTDLLDQLTRDILEVGEAPDLPRHTFEAPE